MLQSWHLPSLLIFKSLHKMYITTGGIVLFNVVLGSIYKVHYSYTLILFPSYFLTGLKNKGTVKSLTLS
jgi:hypothetical protein